MMVLTKRFNGMNYVSNSFNHKRNYEKFFKKTSSHQNFTEGNWEIIIRGDTQIGGKKQAGKNVIEEKFNHYP